MRIGVDVGGTNTDAVLMDGTRVVAAVNTATTADVGSGIAEAIRTVLAAAGTQPDAVLAVMIGTTHFTNAFIERRHLNRIGVVRIAYPATTSIPPLYGWPAELLAAVAGDARIVPGGYEFDGREIAAFDEPAVREAAQAFRRAGLNAVAISSTFAPLNRTMEDRAAGIIAEEIPGARLSLSADFGRLGLLERENAAAMNASLAVLADQVIRSFESALASLGIDAPLYISQNDGTLMAASHAARYPVMTFASGPTNSMRGAALLAGASDALVIDIGGTTTDVGCLTRGFPRESTLSTAIAGVRTNFRMPDIVSIGVGGGSVVHDGAEVRIGPVSVGYELMTRALVFGGETLTASDIAVAAGLADFGDRSRVRHLKAEFVRNALAAIRAAIEGAVDRIKLSAEARPAILVGGGSILIGGELNGISSILVPEHHSVANAVGAAIAQAGGEADRCYSYDLIGREAALADAEAVATASAVAAGASPVTVRVTDVEELPLAYLPGATTRVRMRAVGDMDLIRRSATHAREILQ